MGRIINQEEARKLGLTPAGKKHPIRAQIEKLEPGQLLHITKSEFKWKNLTPLRFCNEISRLTPKKFTVMHTHNKNGWVVERVE